MARNSDLMGVAISHASLKATLAVIKKYNLPKSDVLELHATVFSETMKRIGECVEGNDMEGLFEFIKNEDKEDSE